MEATQNTLKDVFIVEEDGQMYFKLPSFRLIARNFFGVVSDPKYDYMVVKLLREKYGPFKVAARPLSQIKAKSIGGYLCIGEFNSDNQLHGFGLTYEYEWGYLYEGFFTNGILRGKCSIMSSSYQYYLGETNDGRKHGFGILRTFNLTIEGYFKNDQVYIEEATYKHQMFTKEE